MSNVRAHLRKVGELTSKKYAEQWERVRRYHNKFERLGDGIEHTQASPHYDDDVYAFFQNCYHLKDWIKNDPYCTGWSSVETLINSDPNLQLCADLCNGQKHLTLTTHRSNENPQFQGKAINLNITEGMGVSEVKIAMTYNVVTTNRGTIDALVLARDCVNAWDAFITANDP